MIRQLTLAGNDLLQECKRRGLKVAVAGIPKTIDNDLDVGFWQILESDIRATLERIELYDQVLIGTRLCEERRIDLTWNWQVIDKSFGFDTAVEEAQRAINAAHVEAESIHNGIGVVKLMGRYSGGTPLILWKHQHIL